MKPTLGYPSRIAAIQALRGQHCTEREIARRLGIRPSTVTSMEARHRQRRTHVLRVTASAGNDLLEEANARGVSVNRLAVMLLEAIAADDLFSAVLDD